MNKLLINSPPDRKCLMEASARFPEMDPGINEVFLYFLKVSMDVVSEISDYLGKYGISGGRMSILMQLMKEPDKATPPGELAERCGVTPATISGLVDGLIKADYVERLVDPGDRRVQPVRLTKEGIEHMEGLLPGYFKLINRLFKVLDASERESLLGILKKLEANLKNKENDDEA